MCKGTHTRVFIISVGMLCIFGGCTCRMVDYPAQMRRETEQARSRLLCETDHQVLLEGCRKASKELGPGVYTWDLLSADEVGRFPEVIRALQPQFVTVEKNGTVRIEMATKWHPLGVYAYPEGYSERHPQHRYGNRRLVEGLWYYDDGYRPDPAAYDRVIDAILRDCGRLDK